jgi:hypothetical protein
MADLTELTSRVPIIVSYRDAKAEDNAALAEFARNSFVDSFGHTYRPEDLARFLDESYSPQIQGRELADPQVETRLAMRGRKIVGYCQVRALGLPIDGVDPKDAIELRRLYLSPMVQGIGHRRSDDLLGFCAGAGARRQRCLSRRLEPEFARATLLCAPWLSQRGQLWLQGRRSNRRRADPARLGGSLLSSTRIGREF